MSGPSSNPPDTAEAAYADFQAELQAIFQQFVPDLSVRLAAEISLPDLHLSANDWAFAEGPKGGKKWTNKKTGAEVYSKENPGGHEAHKMDFTDYFHAIGADPTSSEARDSVLKHHHDAVEQAMASGEDIHKDALDFHSDLRRARKQKEQARPARSSDAQTPALKYDSEDTKKIQDHSKSLLGRELTPEMASAITGASHGGTVEVSVMRHNTPFLELAAKTDTYKSNRMLQRDKNGKLYLYNDHFEVDKAHQGQGIGAQVLAHQVQEAEKLGVSYIATTAAGYKGHPKYNGYITWPKLGYDGPLEQGYKDELPDEFQKANTIQELFAMPGGAKAWEDHGSDIELTFDLTKGSKSRRILGAYMAKKGLPFDA